MQKSSDSTTHSPIQNTIDSLEKEVLKHYYGKNYGQTIELGNQLILLAKETNDDSKIITTYSFIGNAFLQSEDTLSSRTIFEDNVNRALNLKDPVHIAATQIDLANFYALTGNERKAIALNLSTIPYSKENSDTISLYILHSNIAELSLNNNDTATASFHVKQMTNYLGEKKSPHFEAGSKLLNGRLQLMLNNPQSAVKYLREGNKIAESINFTEILIQGYNDLANAEALLGNYENAYQARENHQKYLAEKYERDKIAAIENVTAKYRLNDYKRRIEAQTKKNELDRQQAARETTILWVKIATGILLIFSIFMIWANLNRKKLLKNLKAKNKQYLVAKEKSEELSKAKSILFSNITHELRTPMYGIIGITSILLNDNKFKEQRENLSSLKFSADYLLSLINNVLYFNKTEANQNDELNKTEFNIRELLRNISETAKFLNSSFPNEILLQIDSAIPETIIGDETKLSQVLMNLLNNSSKFTEKGKIWVNVRRIPTQTTDKIILAFLVKDSGKGISLEKQKKLLENLDKDKITMESANGSGIGLPIVKRILDQHNSKLELSSELGKGTEVSFIIEYELAWTIVSDQTTTIDLPKTSLNGIRILIVDDNKINQLVTKKSVENYGAIACVAGSGLEALSMVAEETFDLILMDINMPEMDGFETTERIRKTLKEIPIIALTAVEKEKVIHQERFGLMNDIVIKPYQGEQFIDTLLKNLRGNAIQI
ncbi:response regulator [Aequorivita sp. SDUM287046]|uniref:histidine kinase n=1 Tax=Aequorivita aurantiaca TaxID=3053356 RepID=A0ABT8DMS9_9FLAO|nr:response regulator [Aequorivita aurantiaca]MDN3725200.1 response regulator [Aequorivita aurantiaca]